MTRAQGCCGASALVLAITGVMDGCTESLCNSISTPTVSEMDLWGETLERFSHSLPAQVRKRSRLYVGLPCPPSSLVHVSSGAAYRKADRVHAPERSMRILVVRLRRLLVGIAAVGLVAVAPDLSGGHAPFCASAPHSPLAFRHRASAPASSGIEALRPPMSRMLRNLTFPFFPPKRNSPLSHKLCPPHSLPAPHCHSGFLGILVAFMCVQAVVGQAMFVAQMAFFARVADPAIGGTAMTLFNTVANLGACNAAPARLIKHQEPRSPSPGLQNRLGLSLAPGAARLSYSRFSPVLVLRPISFFVLR